MQYLHLVPHVVAGPNVIPSLIVPDLILQEFSPPIQDENGDVSEWAKNGSKCFCKVDACISFYVAKWLFYQHLEQTHSLHMQAKKSRCPSICPWGPRQQDHGYMKVHILSNLHARQKWNEKKALD